MDRFGNHLPRLAWAFRTLLTMYWVNGTIMDPFGDPVANLSLIINGEVVAVTDPFGAFSFLIRPGTYQVLVMGEGYESRMVEVAALVGPSLEMNLSMAWARGEIPWTIWLPLPFFLLNVLLIVLYRRRHPNQ
jgi:hypothetical protein